MRYRTKPCEIEAVQYVGTGESFEEIDAFTNGYLYIEEDKPFIKTLEGNMFVSVGDYVIRGTIGEYYPCKEKVFLQKYERIEVE